ncbi:MAG: 50S ribosomal protein L25 [Myxococcales bacterium]|nr:50S ribosomal protein L25 [Myxococcales bacterium]
MQLAKIPAVHRTSSGKNESRRMRNAGSIPAIAYGKGEPAVHIALSPKDLVGVLAQPLGRNSPIELDVEGKGKITVLLTEYQYHPVSRALLHADFLKIALDATVDVEVPLELTGKSKGVVEGGELRQVFRRVPVRCLPKDIPVKLVHDITELGLDESLPVSALALPAGVAVRLPAEQTVAAVATMKKVVEEETAATAAAVAGAAPAAGAAAPAAGAAAAKPEGKADKK